MAGTEISDGWQDQILAAWDEYADTQLGPEIRDDAKRFVPVDTGNLRDSIEHVVATDHALLVSAYGSDERWYAVWVERGHLVAHGRNRPAGPEFVAPRPFLLPALTKHISG